MRYAQDVIDRVREATDIVALVGEQVRLTRAGRSYKGLCPFHTEKTPSFHVNPDRQIYHCFGCGAGGNAITFLIEHAKLTFPEAVRTLAERAGIALPQHSEDAGANLEIGKIHEALALAQEFFRERLNHREVGKPARDYLASRDITMETAESFGLGFAPDGWSHFFDVAVKRFTVDILSKAGLVVPKEGGSGYDRFRNRLMVPIASSSGRVIGFGGRTLGDDDAKYINSPESPVYQKGQLLFGLAMARDAIRRLDEAILVEGYFDHLRVFAAGFTNVVAVAGTAFTPAQAALLRRHAAQVRLVFDGDAAGLNAAWKASGLCLAAGLAPRFVILPEGEDPDSLVRRDGPGAFRAALDEAVDVVGFTAARLVPKLGKEEALRRLVDQIRESPDPIRRRLLVQEAADRLRFDEGVLVKAVEQKRPLGMAPQAPAAAERSRLPASLPKIEAQLLAALIGDPGLVSRLPDLNVNDFEDPRSREIFQHLEELDGTPAALNRLIDAAAGTDWGVHLPGLAADDTPQDDQAAYEMSVTLRRHWYDRTIALSQYEMKMAQQTGDSELEMQHALLIRRLTSEKLSLATGAMTKS